ncbi:T6SS immunity protein Tdi1 domain-containing protein [Hymenobacter terrenus]|uniref:T6SS immunity protein Tdi1 domain-containing protein n=1 Tax=Hymenobacter terrenus TaxID=1629124 RepID=UPI000696A323|nr:T6SS immunity protein Tdi1 domain-containing protein [Hymenobacter terrenus]
MLTKLLARFPEYTIVDRPTPELLTRYRDRVPPELLEVWEQYGFGTFCDGYLKVVNPADYADLLADTYQLTSTAAPDPPLVLFVTAMGDLLVWELDCLGLLDYRHGTTNVVAQNFKVFFRNLSYDSYLSKTLRWEPYPAARERLGEPAFDECFGYVPLLALGGPETVEHLEKVKLREHIALISQFTGLLER